MHLTRRKLIKFLAHLSVASLTCRAIPAMGSEPEPLYGINAFYLMSESYRKVQQNKGADIRKTIIKYLQDDSGLARLRDKSKVNAIRFWTFNNYPSADQEGVKNSLNPALWPTANRMDKYVLEILESLLQCLAELEFYIVPVLSNYWIDYGGILRYLEWSGRITLSDWFDAYCNKKDEEFYLKYSIDFYTLAVEKLFQIHVAPVISCLQNNNKVIIVDIMNEPRGKNHYSVRNQIVRDGLYSHEIVAQWLNRQAEFLRKKLPATVKLTSGEEGWLVSSVNMPLDYLRNESQYFEGVDLKTNLYMKSSALTMGSVHMYPHEAVELSKVNACGNQFVDRRGWPFLLQPHQPPLSQSYIKLGEEWLKSRAIAIANKPWYVGEMGWCRSQSPGNRSPLSATALQRERIEIYRHWTEQAFALGARGVFLWGLDGLQHRDEFYGLSSAQIMAIYPK